MDIMRSKYIKTTKGHRLTCRSCGKQWNVSPYAKVPPKGYICPKCAAKEQRERFTRRMCALLAVSSFIGLLGTMGGMDWGTISPLRSFLMETVFLFLLILTAGRAGAFRPYERDNVSKQPEQERKAS